jgi:CPA2 family monovalent cation:H+ antiporter-2
MASPVAAAEYKDVVLFLATAGIVAPLGQRFRISPTLSFLAAGVALGPYGLGHLSDRLPWLQSFTVSRPDEIAQLAEFGVVFLLFTVGLELSWKRLRAMRRLVFGMGAVQVVATSAMLAVVARLLGLPMAAALAIGAALTLSSTAVGLPALAERNRLQAPAGRAAFSVLLFQDLAVAPILVMLGALRHGSPENFSARDLLALGPELIGLVVLVAGGRLVLRPMMRLVARAKSPELFTAAVLLVVVSAGLASAASGLSMALGAFIAGLLLAETEYRHQVELTVKPFEGLLLGLFFVSVGIGIDLSLLLKEPGLIFGLAAGLLAMKALVAYAAGRAFRLKPRAALEAALALAAGGEFAFVILQDALSAEVLSPAVGDAVIVAATVTMALIPALTALGARIDRRNETLEPSAAPATDERPRVLLVGYGRVGRLVGAMLTRHDVPWLAVERSPRAVEAGRRAGLDLYYGDAANPELLLRCGLATAKALVVTMDSFEQAEIVVGVARQLRPRLPIVARARDAAQAGKLYALGATNAVPETIEASLQLSEAVLVDVGVPMGLIIASVHEKRDEFRKLLNRPDALGAPVRRARDALQKP